MAEIDLPSMSDEEFQALRVAVMREASYRALLLRASNTAEKLVTSYQEAVNRGLPPGTLPAWTQPTGAHDAYPKDFVVRHSGKVWSSLTPANVWEPGVSGWREDSTEGPAPWILPTGAHDAYAKDSVVTHNGLTWRSELDGNVWEPGVYGWVEV